MKVYENISLKPYNTFGIDVKARRMVVVEPEDKVPDLDGEVLVIGAGSNMVFTKDFEGTVIIAGARRTVSDADVVTQSRGGAPSPICVTAWAGMVMDDLIQWTLDHGLYGLENLSAIPGTVGASAVQNVGAYGAEAKDTVVEVETVDLRTSEHRRYTGAECRFGYRTSRFKQQHGGSEIIVNVTFALRDTFVPNLAYKALEGLPHSTAQALRDSITTLRWQKLPRPEEHGSAGSFFKNPVVDEATYMRLKDEWPDMPEAHRGNDGGCKLSAGWLIDRAGWKGRSMGRAGVWPQNALVLYNLGGCTGDEVVALADAIVADVQNKFSITLEPEAIII